MVNIGEKISLLEDTLREMGGVVVAFSGGVDSTFLAAAAKKVLGADRVLLATAYSATSSDEEKKDAADVAAKLGLSHTWLSAGEMENPDFVANTPDRCYFCKKARFTGLIAWAKEQGFDWVVEGTNADDLGDYRPGMRAVAELGVVKSPLLTAGLTKSEIRALSKEWELPTWDKLSAACLVSRLAYGLEVTSERLKQVEKAERLVRRYCRGQVRVRHHGDLARVEVEAADIPRLAESTTAKAIAEGLKAIGFTFVTLDLTGYRTGSMNEMLNEV